MADVQHEDSINSQDPTQHDEKTKTKSRRPANTAFRQQRLKAWQPILTPKTVLPLFFGIAVIFGIIGGLLIMTSFQVQEIVLDYSRCYLDAPDFPKSDLMPEKYVEMHFKKNGSLTEQAKPTWSKTVIDAQYYNGSHLGVTVKDTVQCILTFPVNNNMKPPVLFYYRLTNFYQNHRRYAKSFNTDQLSGKAVSASTIHGSDCTPLTTVVVDNVTKPYYPCGLAANSIFNDTFDSPVLQNSLNGQVNVTYTMNNSTNIAWGSDRELYGQTKYKWEDVVHPPNWEKRYPQGYSDDWHPDFQNDEAFQVWMRLAGLPTFSKLYQRNDVDTMAAGTYEIKINHHFNVIEYGGTKSIIISTRTVVGGRNPFLGIAYTVVAGICLILGFLFTATNLIKPRKLGDHTYLTWNSDNAGPQHGTGGGVLAGEGRDA